VGASLGIAYGHIAGGLWYKTQHLEPTLIALPNAFLDNSLK